MKPAPEISSCSHFSWQHTLFLQGASFVPPGLIRPRAERETETETGLPCFLGRFRNVLLSDEEMLLLQRELPYNWAEYIERLSEYMKSGGKSYQSHLATILRWAKEDAQKKLCAAQRNYSVKESDVV